MSSLPPGVTDAMCEANYIDENQPCGSCDHELNWHDDDKFCHCCKEKHESCDYVFLCEEHELEKPNEKAFIWYCSKNFDNINHHKLFGKAYEKVDANEIYAGKVTSAQPEEVAMLLEVAQRVVIVPGYGMAMAQAQHAVRELADAMEARGVEVDYGIHPVAGRMPGHMNVLLAEAEVPYDNLVEMDRINPTFEDTDVVIVIGANDVTNPMAREAEGSPIYGMPILNVDKAKNVVVIKRSLSPGFAGLPNPLFAMDHTLMVYGDGKKAVVEMTAALNQA